MLIKHWFPFQLCNNQHLRLLRCTAVSPNNRYSSIMCCCRVVASDSTMISGIRHETIPIGVIKVMKTSMFHWSAKANASDGIVLVENESDEWFLLWLCSYLVWLLLTEWSGDPPSLAARSLGFRQNRFAAWLGEEANLSFCGDCGESVWSVLCKTKWIVLKATVSCAIKKIIARKYNSNK